MPDGSSSAAPVMIPGPAIFKSCLTLVPNLAIRKSIPAQKLHRRTILTTRRDGVNPRSLITQFPLYFGIYMQPPAPIRPSRISIRSQAGKPGATEANKPGGAMHTGTPFRLLTPSHSAPGSRPAAHHFPSVPWPGAPQLSVQIWRECYTLANICAQRNRSFQVPVIGH